MLHEAGEDADAVNWLESTTAPAHARRNEIELLN